MTPPTVRIEEVDPTRPEAQWCLAEYYAELRSLFAEGFEAARSLASDPGDFQARQRDVSVIVLDEYWPGAVVWRLRD